ncbi:hypothetical protein DRQ33_03315, partial [bacterium]
MSRALIIRFSSLGDVVLASAVVEALNRNGWKIAFITKPQYAPIFREDDRISMLFEFYSSKNARRQIQQYSPDWIVDLQVDFRSIFLSATSDANVVRTNKRNIQRRLLRWFKWGERKEQSVVDNHLQSLRPLG